MTFADRVVVMNGGRIKQLGRPRAKRERSPNQSVALMVPRGGLPRSCEINEVGFGGTLKTPTRSLGFLPRVSHLGRDVELAKLATSQAQSYANFDPVSEVRRELESTQ